jgi:hypothetical protein
MSPSNRCFITGLGFLLYASTTAFAGGPPPRTVPLRPEAWTATDSIRFVSHLGRSALYINRGVALAREPAMENGVLEMDLAATEATNFLGVVFRAASPRFSNVVFLRPGASGTEEAVQYGPAFNSVGVAWQVYHGEGANAVAELPRDRWIHVRLELDGPVARLFLDSTTTPTLVVPRVVTSGGAGLGVWTGAFGRGAYFSNIRYTAASASRAASPEAAPPPGTIQDWEIPIETDQFTPERLPDLGRLTWERVKVEPEGFVLLNRYREAPVGNVPRDSTGAVMVDSVMTGRIAGARIVYARTTLTAARDEVRRLEYAYSNGAVLYLNGRPVAFGMNPGGLRGLGIMARVGDAVYLPLRRGGNELVFAVIQVTGGWAFSARLEPSEETAALPKVAQVMNGRAESVTYRGARAVKLVPLPAAAGKDEDLLALLDDPDFHNGTIQLDVAGAPRAGAAPDMRGFIGVSVRTGPRGEWTELFYLRPTNGRAEDQLRRNHSVQYQSDPEYPWHRLREEQPGVYEAYADLEAGAWTTMRIEVAGTTARLYVNGASQPCLVVNDLKQGDRAGRIALWAHVTTDAYFGPISVTPR